jgi:two-component system, chemotaxis family, chemotaxis protein CheY
MPRKILTVDDSRTMRDMVSYTLKGAGFEVLEAEDGLKALGVLATTRVDLIITDINMPNMDGVTLVKRVRAGGAHASTPILILTTESGDDRKASGKAAGATGWIVKPFAPEKLLSVVNKVCPA